jgi:hypothetical protein
MNNKLKSLANQIDKYYFSHGQHLILNTREMFTNDEGDCAFDVYLDGSDIFLFEVLNYRGYLDLIEIRPKSYFLKERYKFKEFIDVSYVSQQPLYMDRVFTLKKFTPITKEDIVNCAFYFVREILGLLIFNIKFVEDGKEN